MVLVDLDEVDALCRLHPLWSARRPAPVRFRRSDYLGPSTVPLATAVRRLVEERTGRRPDGPVALLTTFRTWGWLFNPVSCYFCFEPDGRWVDTLVLEVTNTPWHERHAYVVGGPGSHRVDKALHVSPFLGSGLTYRVEYTEPGDTFGLRITVEGPEGVELSTGLALRRRPAGRRALGRLVWRPDLGPMGISAGIYRQALALRRRGIRVHPHPRGTTVGGGCPGA
jgi:DUF1365 family protein